MAIKLIGWLTGNIAEVTAANALKVDPSGSTQPVSGTVAVSNFPATQPVSGTVAVSNFPATQPVSAASLPLPSGASQDGTDATGISQPTGGVGIRGWLSGIFSKLSLFLFNSDGTLAVTCPGRSISGSITTTQNVAISLIGMNGVGFDVTGTWTGTVVSEALIGITWESIDIFADKNNGEQVSSSVTSNGTYSALIPAGATQFRIRGNTVLSGTATINLAATMISQSYPTYIRGSGDTGPASYGVCSGGADDLNTFRLNPANRNGERITAGRNSYREITASGTTTLKSGWGRLRGIAVGSTGTAGTVTVYDNTAGSGTKIGTITLSSTSGWQNMDCEFLTGLTVVATGFTGSPSITFLWN